MRMVIILDRALWSVVILENRIGVILKNDLGRVSRARSRRTRDRHRDGQSREVFSCISVARSHDIDT